MKNKFKTYFAISDSLDHDAKNFHVMKTEFIDLLKMDLKDWGINIENLKKMIYLSDGAAGQYKNHKNFTNLLLHLRDFGFAAEWHFTATSHGKGQCDAMIAVVKRAARLESLKKGHHILDATELFHFCLQKLTTPKLQFFFISKTRVQEINDPLVDRYKLSKTIPGTRSFHSFVPVSSNTLELRILSSSIDSIKYTVGHIDPPPPDLSVEQFVAVKVERKWQVGQITLVDAETMDIEISFMKRVGNGNQLRWPVSPIIDYIPFSFVLCNIKSPVPIGDDGAKFKMTDKDYQLVKTKLN
jgi:hypothetical protein